MATVGFDIQGPFVPYISGAKQSIAQKIPLGISRGPGRIRLNYYENPMMADNAGPRIPADIQDMGKDAVISFQLTEVDPVALALITAVGDAPDEGSLGSMGLPLGASLSTFRLHIPTNTIGNALPWTFFTCKLRSRNDARGTEYTPFDLEIYSWALIGNTINTKGLKLYSRTF